MPVIPSLRELREEHGYKFEAIMSYVARSRPVKTVEKKIMTS